MSEEIKTYDGFIGIVRPGEDEVDFQPYSYSTDEAGLNEAFVKIIEYITKKEGSDELGKIANAGYLPSPFSHYTMFMDYDQFDPDTKYNVGFFGTPVYGTMAFLYVDTDSEEGKVYPIPEDKKKELSDSILHFKKFEKDSGIYDAMIKTDKAKFLEEFINEKNNILEEATKEIKGDKYDELQAAKKELEELTGTTNE